MPPCSIHRAQQVSQRDGCEPRGLIGQSIRNNQFAVVQQGAASIDDIGHVAFTLVLIRLEQWLAKPSNHFTWIIAIQQERTNAILSHRANAVAEYQPAGIRFDRRSAVPELNQFPRKLRLEQRRAPIPEVDVVGEHKVDIFVILPRKHGVISFYLPREHRHPFVLRGWTVQRDEPEQKEIGSLYQFRHHHLAIIGRESRVINVTAVRLLEADEPGVFNAVALWWSCRENNALREFLVRLELDLVGGTGQKPNTLRLQLIFPRHSIRQAKLFGLEAAAQVFQRERNPKFVQNPARKFAIQSQLREFSLEQPLLIQQVWNLTRLSQEAGGLHHLDSIIGMQDPGSKCNRRDR